MEQSSSWEAATQLSRNSPLFMETEGSLPYPQQPTTGPNPEPDASNSHLLTLFP